MAATATIALRMLVAIFGCVGLFAYSYAVDGFASCIEVHNRWLMALYADFFLNVAIFAAWVIYKESNWITASIVIVLICVFSSIATSGYILLQLFKFPPEESSNNMFYFVLSRNQKGDVTRHKWGCSVVTARVIFFVIGFLMLGTFIYLPIVGGSPFNAKVFTPCLIGILTDFYVNTALLSMWVAYKESSWISALFWILSFVCLGSVTTCVYIVRQTFYLSPQQPISLILFNHKHRNLLSSEPLLTTHGNM